VSEGAQNLQQQIQQQTIHSAKDFYGDSLGRAKAQLQDARTQLESLAEQIPQEEAQAQIQEMADSYYEMESKIDQAAQDQGLEDAVNEAAQQGQDTAGEAAGQAQQTDGQVTEQAGQAAQGVQETAGQAVQGAQDAAGEVAGQAGQATQQAQESVGQATQQGGGQQQGGGGQEEPNATQAAAQKAEELGVDLSQVEGTGSEGRITIKDVMGAANQG
jgi:hypothetical protein